MATTTRDDLRDACEATRAALDAYTTDKPYRRAKLLETAQLLVDAVTAALADQTAAETTPCPHPPVFGFLPDDHALVGPGEPIPDGWAPTGLRGTWRVVRRCSFADDVNEYLANHHAGEGMSGCWPPAVVLKAADQLRAEGNR